MAVSSHCCRAVWNSSERVDLSLVNVVDKEREREREAMPRYLLASLYKYTLQVYFKMYICLHDGTSSKMWELKVRWGTHWARAVHLSPSVSTVSLRVLLHELNTRVISVHGPTNTKLIKNNYIISYIILKTGTAMLTMHNRSMPNLHSYWTH